jgi:aconitate hydratase
MGAELGATTTIFPSDEVTKIYLEKQGRGNKYTPLVADKNAHYDEKLTIDLSALEPLISCPDSPDLVVPVSEVAGTKVDQVAIGSCTNSSYSDLMEVANVLKGRMVHPNVAMSLSPGSRQVLQMISRNGALADIVAAGVRLLESACGPCAGIGQVPRHGAVSVRSFNRNFPGRSGGLHNRVYLTSPIVCAVTALKGEIVDPREFLNEGIRYIATPEKYITDDLAIIPPADDPSAVDIRRGPNIKPIPKKDPIGNDLSGKILIKLKDNISTDHILPAGTVTLALRSNIPAISEYVFSYIDSEFVSRVKKAGKGFIIAGHNYGQGSSREHAALCPSYLGIQAVLAKSFARIHKDNLINYGVIPITFRDEFNYDELGIGNKLEINNIAQSLNTNDTQINVMNTTNGKKIRCDLDVTGRQREILLAGGLINQVGV